MKKVLITVLMIFSCYHLVTAQKASDVLENGIRILPGQKLFLQYDKTLKFDAAKSLHDLANPLDYTTLDDSAIFLVSKNGLNVYLQPLNPLNFSYNTENKFVIDPINEAATNAMGSFIGVLEKVISSTQTESESSKSNLQSEQLKLKDICLQSRTELIKKIEAVQMNLSFSKKSQINEIFTKLKSLDFASEENTIKELTSIETSIIEIEKHFIKNDDLMTEAIFCLNKYQIICMIDFNDKYIFNSILKDLATTNEEQKKRLVYLQTAYTLVKNAQYTASIGGGVKGLKWCFNLGEVPSKEGIISKYTITIKESGYILSDKEELVSLESKDILEKTVKIRKFQLFVPEVSSGIVFTFYNYYKYGTTSDSTGQQFIASPNEIAAKNINITAMINWNLYSPDSPISPLMQVGVGINAEIPTVLAGVGLRFSNNATNRIRITGGLAMTWLKELDKLKEGDKVTGTADIEKDLKYSSSPKFKPYIGIQYNF